MCGVATQGDINGNKWVTDFKMSYLTDDRIWTPYKDGNEDVVRTELLFLRKLRLIAQGPDMFIRNGKYDNRS